MIDQSSNKILSSDKNFYKHDSVIELMNNISTVIFGQNNLNFKYKN